MQSLLALEKDEFLKLLAVAKREDEVTWLMMLDTSGDSPEQSFGKLRQALQENMQ